MGSEMCIRDRLGTVWRDGVQQPLGKDGFRFRFRVKNRFRRGLYIGLDSGLRVDGYWGLDNQGNGNEYGLKR